LEEDRYGFSREKELGLLIPVISTNITVLRFYNVIYSKFYKKKSKENNLLTNIEFIKNINIKIERKDI